MVLGGGGDIETPLHWLSKVASGAVGISKEGITVDIFSAAERLVEGFKVNVGKRIEEVGKSVTGLFEVPCVSRDETDVWVAVIFCVNDGILLTMGIDEELVI